MQWKSGRSDSSRIEEGNGMEKVESVYDAWKAGILAKFLAGEDGSDHSSPAILNVPTPVDWVDMARRVWSVYDRLDKQDKPIFLKDYETALTNLIHGSLYEIWAAAYILSMQLPYQKENNKKAPFAISTSVNNLFWETVQEKKEKLTQYYPEGPDGLNAYDDIIRLDRILLRHYGNSYSSEYNKK